MTALAQAPAPGSVCDTLGHKRAGPDAQGWYFCARCGDRLNRKRAEYVRALVDTWPPLTAEQRDRLRPLLNPSTP